LQVGWSKDLDESFARFMTEKDPTFKASIGWPEKP
jgi:hypothetical protein